ncbi:hypothetical protein Tco_0300189 [Tanacetum coccineum]
MIRKLSGQAPVSKHLDFNTNGISSCSAEPQSITKVALRHAYCKNLWFNIVLKNSLKKHHIASDFELFPGRDEALRTSPFIPIQCFQASALSHICTMTVIEVFDEERRFSVTAGPPPDITGRPGVEGEP